MSTRRVFIKQISTLAAASCIPPSLVSASDSFSRVKEVARPAVSTDKIWAGFLHLSFNFAGGIHNWGGFRTEFEPDQSLWDDAVKTMSEQGLNMILINLDDSVLWHSHPEISLKNSWTPERLHDELEKIRAVGIEPIPVLNFSATHSRWMGKYFNMLSSKKFYSFCRDLIAEAIDIFDYPRFIHFGMDEEIDRYQQRFDRINVRLGNQWWHDLYFYVSEAMDHGARAWVWSDYIWHNPDIFLKMMPKSVLQSNWYYQENFDEDTLVGIRKTQVNAYRLLQEEGYDQVPTASFDQNNPKSIGNTVEYCSKVIDDKHLLGFMQSSWMPATEKYREKIIKGIELTGEARRSYEAKRI